MAILTRRERAELRTVLQLSSHFHNFHVNGSRGSSSTFCAKSDLRHSLCSSLTL